MIKIIIISKLRQIVMLSNHKIMPIQHRKNNNLAMLTHQILTKITISPNNILKHKNLEALKIIEFNIQQIQSLMM